MIVCGDAADGIGDSMYEGTVYVGGQVASLGADCIEAEMGADDRELLARELGPHGIDAGPVMEEARRRAQAVELLPPRVRRMEGGAVSEFIPRGADGHVLQKLWVWSPETIQDIQTKAELGRYTNRALGTTRRTPHFEDLTFVPCTLSRVPLEGYRETCRTDIEIGARHGAKPIRLRTPITIAGMSYGALSRNAKAALGTAATRVGISTTTGDGGMLDLEREASDQLVYQVLPSRYGFNPHHLRMANAAEIVIGQGAKPGTGGVLLGAKVSEIIAEPAHAAARRRPALALPPPGLHRPRRPPDQDRGAARGHRRQHPDLRQDRRLPRARRRQAGLQGGRRRDRDRRPRGRHRRVAGLADGPHGHPDAGRHRRGGRLRSARCAWRASST